jgi:ribosomal protein S18 acetylase RimI-like enzyme
LTSFTASKLLEHIMENARKDKTVSEVYLHVQTSNTDAKNFYEYHGFENVGVATNYYTRVDPPDAFILRKVITRTEEDEQTAASGVVEEEEKN